MEQKKRESNTRIAINVIPHHSRANKENEYDNNKSKTFLTFEIKTKSGDKQICGSFCRMSCILFIFLESLTYWLYFGVWPNEANCQTHGGFYSKHCHFAFIVCKFRTICLVRSIYRSLLHDLSGAIQCKLSLNRNFWFVGTFMSSMHGRMHLHLTKKKKTECAMQAKKLKRPHEVFVSKNVNGIKCSRRYHQRERERTKNVNWVKIYGF